MGQFLLQLLEVPSVLGGANSQRNSHAIAPFFYCDYFPICLRAVALARGVGDDGLLKQPWFLDRLPEFAPDFEMVEAVHLPGFIKPVHYLSSLEYVAKEVPKENFS